MKMYALYDTVTKRYATCLNFPHFDRKKNWSDGALGARLHSKPGTMKVALKQVMWRLNMNVDMLLKGAWKDRPDMLNWSIECERRQAEKLVNFGLVVVEVDDADITPNIV